MMKNNINLLALLCLVMFCGLTSCSTRNTQMQQQEVSKQRVLKHIVALQFKEEVSKEQREQAIQNFRDLQGEIPQIMAFEGGEEISVEELAKGFTHCFILTFKDEKQLEIFISLIQHILGLQSKTSPCLATC